METVLRHDPAVNPSVLLETLFREVAVTRMAGVPIVNPMLGVEAVDFRLWQGVWLGGMVMPWSINLMLLSAGSEAFLPIGVGQTQDWLFPSGTYEFMGGYEEALGPYQVCSLFSPVFEFDNHATAVATARAALDALMAAPAGGGDVLAEDEERAARDRVRVSGGSLKEAPLSRRAFLRGGL